MRVGTLLGPDLHQLLIDEPAEIVELVAELHPEDVTDVLRELPPRESAAVLAHLGSRDAARLFERMDDHEQCDLLPFLAPGSSVDLVAAMAPDRRAKLLQVLPAKERETILSSLGEHHPAAAAEVALIDRWPEKSAARLMTTSFVALPLVATVGDALEALRAHGACSNEPVHGVYGIDEGGRLAAFARLRELAVLERERPLSDVWRKQVVTVTPAEGEAEVARIMAKYDLAAVPVVDDDDRLLGVVTIDDVVDVLTRDNTRALEKAGGVEPLDLPYFRTSFIAFIRKRGLWLIVLFLEEFFTQTALRHYDPVFEAIHGASYYVPLLISTGGNSGSQSSTLIIRGLSVREIQLRDWRRILARETGMGLALGLILGIIGFFRVLMYRDQGLAFAFTIGITLVGIVIMGCVVGSMLPLGLRRLGIDPATSSTPFIASLVDVLGIIIFVHVAKIIMADVIAHAAHVR